MRNNINHTPFWKTKSFVVASLLIVSALVGSSLYLANHRAKQSSANNPSSTTDTINLDPPSEAELKAGEQPSNEPMDNEERTNPGNNTSKKPVVPIISTWVQNSQNKNIEVNGFVSTVVEEGGNCTLILEKQDNKVSVDKKARADAQTTTCGLIVVARSSLSLGEWNATLIYSSPFSEGTSETVKIEVK